MSQLARDNTRLSRDVGAASRSRSASGEDDGPSLGVEEPLRNGISIIVPKAEGSEEESGSESDSSTGSSLRHEAVEFYYREGIHRAGNDEDGPTSSGGAFAPPPRQPQRQSSGNYVGGSSSSTGRGGPASRFISLSSAPPGYSSSNTNMTTGIPATSSTTVAQSPLGSSIQGNQLKKNLSGDFIHSSVAAIRRGDPEALRKIKPISSPGNNISPRLVNMAETAMQKHKGEAKDRRQRMKQTLDNLDHYTMDHTGVPLERQWRGDMTKRQASPSNEMGYWSRNVIEQNLGAEQFGERKVCNF